jgi:lipopolysaccharide heptosyltransferase II
MLYSIICNAKFRIDFGTGRLRKYFKKSAIRPKKIEHYCLRYLNVLDEIGPLTKKTKLYLETDPEADKWVENKFAELGIYSQDFIVIFHPFAEWRGREWAVHKFAEAADYCSSHYNAKIIITGKKEDKERANKMVNLMAGEAYNLVGATTLKALIALISKADIFVCNDGGPMHIAAALNVPLLALFGPQTPLIFGPWSENNEVIYHKKDCSPCGQRYCRKKPSCMELIEVEEVIKAMEKLCKKAQEPSQIPSELVI